jgi:hypothetical protein
MGAIMIPSRAICMIFDPSSWDFQQSVKEDIHGSTDDSDLNSQGRHHLSGLQRALSIPPKPCTPFSVLLPAS